jgi:hypothetical protein
VVSAFPGPSGICASAAIAKKVRTNTSRMLR